MYSMFGEVALIHSSLSFRFRNSRLSHDGSDEGLT